MARVLIVGGGAVGTMAAYNLEAGGLAETTMVLRSNYDAVRDKGFTIDSCQHGSRIEGWRPRGGVVSSPSAATTTATSRFDYVICCTKNVPDVPPLLADLIRPVVTPAHSVIVLIQNGIHIEKPVIEAFPHNIVLSGISLIGAIEPELGHILHNGADTLMIGAFDNPNLDRESQGRAARDFYKLYAASGKVEALLDSDVAWTRWRKLLYNAVYNPISALTNTDTARLRLSARQDKDQQRSHNVLDGLILPAMREIQAAARAHGIELKDELLAQIVDADPMAHDSPLPSMQQDVQKGRFIECEVILGETLRSGEAKGVDMPILRTLYCMCRAVQFRACEAAGHFDTAQLVRRYQS